MSAAKKRNLPIDEVSNEKQDRRAVLKSCQKLTTTKSTIEVVSDHPMKASSLHRLVPGTAHIKIPSPAPAQLERGYGIIFPISRVETSSEFKFWQLLCGLPPLECQGPAWFRLRRVLGGDG